MSIQDIANYVRQTPGNTNPSVIKSMVKGEIGEYVEEAAIYAKNEVVHELENSGRIGKGDHHVVTMPMHSTRPIDFHISFLVGMRYWSPLTPSKEDLLGTMLRIRTPGDSLNWPITEDLVVASTDAGLIIGDELFVAVAYKTGKHTFNFGNSSQTIDFPKTGIYGVGFVIEDESQVEASYMQLEWGTVEPIDRKYMPDPVMIDLDDLGLTQIVLELVNSNGGGRSVAHPYNHWWGRDDVQNANAITIKTSIPVGSAGSEARIVYTPGTFISNIALNARVCSITANVVYNNVLILVQLIAMPSGTDENGQIIWDGTYVGVKILS